MGILYPELLMLTEALRACYEKLVLASTYEQNDLYNSLTL